MKKDILIDKLNDSNINVRLDSLRELKKMLDSGEITKPITGKDVNNHIHTTFSFSPYSPTKALWMAYMNGLETAGIVDHDSIGGAKEFIEAGKIIGIATTVGFEIRASVKNTPLEGQKINHPDQDSVIYMCIHGVPHTMIDSAQEFLAPYRDFRNIRNRKMIENINRVININEISLNFDIDILPISEAANGGSVTERHVLFALANKIISYCGKGRKLINFMQEKLDIKVSGKTAEQLDDINNIYYEYDLLGLLKSNLVEKIYVNATDECPHVNEVLDFANKIGAIASYAYLGDILGSVTGDKKDQKFEDDFIDLLFKTIKELGFKAVTYMPARNTKDQLDRVRKLCDEYGFFQISGEDINSPRQSFICMAQRNPEFKNLYTATWALIGHEIESTKNLANGMFSKEMIDKIPDLNNRIDHFSKI